MADPTTVALAYTQPGQCRRRKMSKLSSTKPYEHAAHMRTALVVNDTLHPHQTSNSASEGYGVGISSLCATAGEHTGRGHDCHGKGGGRYHPDATKIDSGAPTRRRSTAPIRTHIGQAEDRKTRKETLTGGSQEAGTGWEENGVLAFLHPVGQTLRPHAFVCLRDIVA